MVTHLQRWQVPCRLHSLEWVWSIPLHVWVAKHLPSNLTTGMYFREQDILYLRTVETGQVLTSKVLSVWQQLEVCDCTLTSLEWAWLTPLHNRNMAVTMVTCLQTLLGRLPVYPLTGSKVFTVMLATPPGERVITFITQGSLQ